MFVLITHGLVDISKDIPFKNYVYFDRKMSTVILKIEIIDNFRLLVGGSSSYGPEQIEYSSLTLLTASLLTILNDSINDFQRGLNDQAFYGFYSLT